MVLEYFGALAFEKSINNEDKTKFFDYFTNVTPLGTIITFIISIATAYLAYQCNKKTGLIIRILSTIFAFFFSGLYLIYYLFAHVLFGKGCDTTPINIKKVKNRGKKLKRNLIKKGKNLEKKL